MYKIANESGVSELTKDRRSIKPENIYTPKQAYTHNVKNKELADKLYADAMAARREAMTKLYKKHKVSTIFNWIPRSGFMPVAPYPSEFQRVDLFAKTNPYKTYQAPVAEVTRRALPVGPFAGKPIPYKEYVSDATLHSLNSPYSSVIYTGTDDMKKAFDSMHPSIVEATQRKYPGMLEALKPTWIKDPKKVKDHEIAHPASMTAFIPGSDNYIGTIVQHPETSDLKNSRKDYGLLVDEGLLALHALKKAWANRYNQLPPKDFDQMWRKLRGRQWINEDGTINRERFDGTGIDPTNMNIESLFEGFVKRLKPDKDNSDQYSEGTMLQNLRWYWPQANNIRSKSQSDNIQSTYVG